MLCNNFIFKNKKFFFKFKASYKVLILLFYLNYCGSAIFQKLYFWPGNSPPFQKGGYVYKSGAGSEPSSQFLVGATNFAFSSSRSISIIQFQFQSTENVLSLTLLQLLLLPSLLPTLTSCCATKPKTNFCQQTHTSGESLLIAELIGTSSSILLPC